jgi:hypothetical protein
VALVRLDVEMPKLRTPSRLYTNTDIFSKSSMVSRESVQVVYQYPHFIIMLNMVTCESGDRNLSRLYISNVKFCRTYWLNAIVRRTDMDRAPGAAARLVVVTAVAVAFIPDTLVTWNES